MEDIGKPNTWLLYSPSIYKFLEATYTDGHNGEIWIFNNDLEAITTNSIFREMYLNLISMRLFDRIDAVKFILTKENYNRVVNDSAVSNQLKKVLVLKNGLSRLSTFYFSCIDDFEDLDSIELINSTWIFYTHKGFIDREGGLVIYRPKSFPLGDDIPFEERASLIWQMKDHPVLSRRLRGKFNQSFRHENKFSYLIQDSNEDLVFTHGTSPETQRRKKIRGGLSPKTLLFDDPVDVVVISALSSENDSFLRVINNNGHEIYKTPFYEHEYTIINNDKGREVKVLFMHLADMGVIPATFETSRIIQRFNPKNLIMIGVCGGAEDKTSLGDVMIADQILYYDKGQLHENGVTKLSLHSYSGGGKEINRKAKRLRTNLGKKISITFDGNSHVCNIIDEITMASGSKLIHDPNFFFDLRRSHIKTYATEMEAAGFAAACEASHKDQFIVIKSVMDFCDLKSRHSSKEKKKWKFVAAESSAKFAYELIKIL